MFSAQRRAVIRYDPQAPLSVLPQSEDEINAYYAIGDEPTLDRFFARNFLDLYPNAA